MKVPHRQMTLLHQYATSCVKGGTHKFKMFPLFTDRLLRLKDLKYLFPTAHQRGCDTQTEMHIHLTTDSVYQCPPMVITLPLSYLWYFMSIKYMSTTVCWINILWRFMCFSHGSTTIFGSFRNYVLSRRSLLGDDLEHYIHFCSGQGSLSLGPTMWKLTLSHVY